jgi:hypothetical protein
MQTECAAAVCAPVANGKVDSHINKPKGWEKCTVSAFKMLHIAYYGDYAKSMSATWQWMNT